MRRLPLVVLAAAALLSPAAALASTPAPPADRAFEIEGLVLGGQKVEASGKLEIEGDSSLIASVGCNTIGGPVTVDGDRVSIDGSLSMTEMGCLGSVGAAEDVLVKILGDGPFTIGNGSWIGDGASIVAIELPAASPGPDLTPPDQVVSSSPGAGGAASQSCPPLPIDGNPVDGGPGAAGGASGSSSGGGTTGTGGSATGQGSGGVGPGASGGTVDVPPVPPEPAPAATAADNPAATAADAPAGTAADLPAMSPPVAPPPAATPPDQVGSGSGGGAGTPGQPPTELASPGPVPSDCFGLDRTDHLTGAGAIPPKADSSGDPTLGGAAAAPELAVDDASASASWVPVVAGVAGLVVLGLGALVVIRRRTSPPAA